jgi:hypothetical protein
MALIAPLNANLKVDLSGDQFLKIIELQAAENAADRALLREGIQQLGQVGQGFFALQMAKENRRAEEARAAILAHQVRLAELAELAKSEPKSAPKQPRSKKTSTTSHINGVYKDLD